MRNKNDSKLKENWFRMECFFLMFKSCIKNNFKNTNTSLKILHTEISFIFFNRAISESFHVYIIHIKSVSKDHLADIFQMLIFCLIINFSELVIFFHCYKIAFFLNSFICFWRVHLLIEKIFFNKIKLFYTLMHLNISMYTYRFRFKFDSK